jgi:hypothetical protein
MATVCGVTLTLLAGPLAAATLPNASAVREISRDNLACPSNDRTTNDTACQKDTEPEQDIGINPTNPNNLVGVFQMGRYANGGAVNIGWSTSLDGGKTWPYKGSAPGLTIGVTSKDSDGTGPPYERSSDPVVAFDRKHHRVYLNGIGVSVFGCAVYCTSALTVNISKDNGKAFGAPVIVHENAENPQANGSWKFNDKNWITVDNNPNSPHYGRAYVVWDQVTCPPVDCSTIPVSQPIVLKYSDDGGKTWHPNSPIQATNAQPTAAFEEIGVQPVVLPNGHIVIVYADVQAGLYTFFGSFKAIRSTDGGQTWSAPTTVAPADAFAEEGYNLRAPNVPSAFVRGKTIYVGYHHLPADSPDPPTANDIFLTKSTDEGQTWSPPEDVTIADPLMDHFTPDIAVAGGMVHVTYRSHLPASVDASSEVAAVYLPVRIAPSSPFFVPGTPITLKVSDANFAAFTTMGAFKFFGDYAGIVAANCIAHPIWGQSQEFQNQSDNDTNTHERAFSARVRYANNCETREGGGEGGGDD